MAHLGRKGPWFVARFTYQRKEYKRSLKTKDRADAQAALREAENRIHDLHRGKAKVPPNVDPGDYVVWGEAAQGLRLNSDPVPSFSQLVDAYLAAHTDLKAPSTITTERIHLRNIERCLDSAANRPVDQLRHRDLERALLERFHVVSSTTVKKERQTLLSLFSWAIQQEYLESSPAAALPMIKSDHNRPPFRTLDEIDEIVNRGELDADELEGVWECLYLTQKEIGEILSLVNERAQEDFVLPMFTITAYTGMRRGEMMRLRWLDVDFRRKVVTASSRKQSRQQKETHREIDLHPEVEAILLEYRAKRPHGRHVICWADTLKPLTKDHASNHFKRPLKGTRWERAMPSGKKKVIIGFHTFRHSFASNLAIQGVDQRIIDKWMGHQTEEMRKRYQHLFPSKLAEAIRALSFGPART